MAVIIFDLINYILSKFMLLTGFLDILGQLTSVGQITKEQFLGEHLIATSNVLKVIYAVLHQVL